MANKYCPYCGYIYHIPLKEGEPTCPKCKADVSEITMKTEKKAKADKIKEDKE